MSAAEILEAQILDRIEGMRMRGHDLDARESVVDADQVAQILAEWALEYFAGRTVHDGEVLRLVQPLMVTPDCDDDAVFLPRNWSPERIAQAPNRGREGFIKPATIAEDEWPGYTAEPVFIRRPEEQSA